MPDIYTTPQTAYLLRENIIYPLAANTALVTAEEAAARTELNNRFGITVTGGSIQRK